MSFNSGVEYKLIKLKQIWRKILNFIIIKLNQRKGIKFWYQ